MPRVRKMRIVASGIQKNGQPVTKGQLESVVRNYKSDSRPPITPGHPTKGSDQTAALGRVANLRTEDVVIDGQEKTALMGEVLYTPELESKEDSGEFEGFSAGIYPLPDKSGEWYMHHLAVLGQLPPAADTKTLDVINLSDSDFSEDAIILSADVGTPNSNKKIEGLETMDEAKLKALLKEVVKEEMGTKPPGAPSTDPKPAVKPEVTSTKEPGTENKEVSEMRESMATDRREQLTELADTREMTDALRASVKTMIDSATPIELCAGGDSSRYSELKNMIKAMPEKTGNKPNKAEPLDELLKEINLAANPTGDAATFDSEGW
ncbi:hypothetical protein WAX87_11130 [Photobacterium damselae subsp. damselae]|uniref:hypothetical protein n=1 Tax=Photobacterium damselae TaxID=38293 RepID=UPI00311AF276